MPTHFQHFSDTKESRTLNMAVRITPGNMTIESCLDFCTSEGYNKYAGVEYGRVSCHLFYLFLTDFIFTVKSVGML